MSLAEPKPFQLEKAGVRAAFDRAAVTYEAAAVLQLRVAEELLGRLTPFDFHPRSFSTSAPARGAWQPSSNAATAALA